MLRLTDYGSMHVNPAEGLCDNMWVTIDVLCRPEDSRVHMNVDILKDLYLKLYPEAKLYLIQGGIAVVDDVSACQYQLGASMIHSLPDHFDLPEAYQGNSVIVAIRTTPINGDYNSERNGTEGKTTMGNVAKGTDYSHMISDTEHWLSVDVIDTPEGHKLHINVDMVKKEYCSKYPDATIYLIKRTVQVVTDQAACDECIGRMQVKNASSSINIDPKYNLGSLIVAIRKTPIVKEVWGVKAESGQDQDAKEVWGAKGEAGTDCRGYAGPEGREGPKPPSGDVSQAVGDSYKYGGYMSFTGKINMDAGEIKKLKLSDVKGPKDLNLQADNLKRIISDRARNAGANPDILEIVYYMFAEYLNEVLDEASANFDKLRAVYDMRGEEIKTLTRSLRVAEVEVAELKLKIAQMRLQEDIKLVV